MSETVGVIGLGQMGSPIAERLSTEHDVTVFDVDDAAVARFVAHRNARPADSPSQVAERCDTVITVLPNSHIVRDVVLDAGASCASALRSGQLVIDMSSSAPADTVALGARLASMGVDLVDAPVSGGVARALAGQIAILLGGDDENARTRAASLLTPVGDPIITVGRLGAGHTMKALNNLLSAIGLAATAEVLAAGAASGIDREVMLDVLNASSGRNNSTENKIRQFVYSGTMDSGFALDLMVKDIHLAIDVIKRSETEDQLAQVCAQLWDDAATSLSGSDHTAIVEWIGAPAGSSRRV